MKSIKNKILAAAIIFAFGISVIGCGKQEKKETPENKEQKPETTQPQNQDKQDVLEEKAGDSRGTDNEHQDMKMDNSSGIEHKMVKIPSAQCDVCKENITRALKKAGGIKSFNVDIDKKTVHVNFNKDVTDLSKIEKAITLAGYDANDRKADKDAYSKLDDCCKKPEDRKK